jgi:hypothetical protein
MFTQIYLGKEVLQANDFGEKERSLVFSDTSFFCEEKSVKYNEFYQAMKTGLNPTKVVKMNKYEYYSYMKDVLNVDCKRYARVLHSITNDLIDYTIIRDYEVDDDSIELTLTRGLENANT